MHTYRDEDVIRHIDADSPTPLIRWSAIVGGLVLGLALLALLSSLWLALAYSSEIGPVLENLEWFVGISGIVALFVAAVLTGYLSGVRGTGTGVLHGFTLWGALLIITLTVGIPSILNVFSLGQITSEGADGLLTTGGAETALWAGFWTILGGFVAAGIGGAVGGAMSRGVRTRTRTVVVDEAADRRDHVEDRDTAVVRDDDGEMAPTDRPVQRTPSFLDPDRDEDGVDDDTERRTYRVS
jgi:hypothetical protein